MIHYKLGIFYRNSIRSIGNIPESGVTMDINAHLAAFQARTGIHFTDPSILTTALTHTSFKQEINTQPTNSHYLGNFYKIITTLLYFI